MKMVHIEFATETLEEKGNFMLLKVTDENALFFNPEMKYCIAEQRGFATHGIMGYKDLDSAKTAWESYD